ncbi:MAG: hypothetical protein KBS83_04480 [Lachnospiraceae bacterium]|nr:hypothetical protein [Candidatus Equihabitans merdae]
MRRRMEHLRNGTYEPFVPQLIVSPDRIEISLARHEAYDFTLHVGTEEDSRINGYISSDDPRLFTEDTSFEGTSCALVCHIDTRGLMPGDAFDGHIVVTTSVGERSIPVHAEIMEAAEKRLPDHLRYLEDFTACAKRDYEEAFRFFTGGRFTQLLQGEYSSLRSLYLGLAQNPVTLQRMEEFLVSAGQKERVSLSLEKEEAIFHKVGDTRREEVRIMRSGWGYLNYRVEVRGHFLEVSKKRLTEDDFVGSVFDLTYIIRGDKMGAGKCEGAIVLKSDDQELVFKVVATKNAAHSTSEARAMKKAGIRLAKTYRAFRFNQMDTRSWASKTLTTVSALREMGCTQTALTIYEAYVCFTTGDAGSAKRLLRSLQDHDFKPDSLEVKAGFLYLCHMCGLLTPGAIDVVGRLRDWHNRSRESMIMLFLRMQVDEDLKRSPQKTMMLLEETFNEGSRNPLVYIEALSLLRYRTDLLRSLNNFTRHVLSYGRRNGLLTDDLYRMIAVLSDNEKVFRRDVYAILAEGYEKLKTKDILTAICRLIIKGQPRNRDYFKWYELAIEEEVRLTRVFEYYIETIPDTYQKKLPLKVRKYFLMSSNVNRDRLAFMYANILKHRDDDPVSYEAFLEQMQNFAGQALMDGLINRDYAALYREFYPRVEDRVVGCALADVCFTARVYCADRRMKEVAVCHEELAYEAVTPLINGEAYIQLYTPSARIFFCDEKGNRYVSDVAYGLEKLMDGDLLTDDCLRLKVDRIGVCLHAMAGMEAHSKVNADNLEAYIYLSEHEAMTPFFKRDIRRKLLQYFSANLSNEAIDPYLDKLNYMHMVRVDKVSLIETLIVRGFWERAYELISRYGCERVNPTSMLHMVSQKIASCEGEKDQQLLKMATYVYDHRKYDERILNYLMAHAETTFEKMLSIRRDAAAFYLDTYGIDDRIICKAMYIQRPLPEQTHVLEQYRREGGREDVCRAYLGFVAAFYLIDGCQMDDYEQHLLRNAYEKGWAKDDTCALALLKSLAAKSSMTESEEALAEEILDDMLSRGIRLGFFQKLPSSMLAGSGLTDRVFVETAAGERDKVTLYFRMEDGRGSARVYQSEPMTMVSSNIYSKEFVLFYGEVLHYYMTVEHGGKLVQTAEKTRTMKTVDMTGRSAAQLINQMLSAHRLGKKELLEEKIREYRKAVSMGQRLFTLQEND